MHALILPWSVGHVFAVFERGSIRERRTFG